MDCYESRSYFSRHIYPPIYTTLVAKCNETALWVLNLDDNTSVLSLRREVSKFRDARGWLKSDTPRSLAISISIEAAELLEHFQWKNDDKMREVLMDRDVKQKISDELADVMIYCLGFSDALAIDVSDAIMGKIRKNREKYPVPEQSLSA